MNTHTKAPAEPALEWSKVSDLHLPDDEDDGYLVWPGGYAPTGEILEKAKELRKSIKFQVANLGEVPKDMRIEDGKISYRVHRQRTAKGTIFILRAILKEVQPLSSLGLGSSLVSYLTTRSLGSNGGLVLITGEVGAGKSTTAASLVVERVNRWQSYAVTVENPLEYGLQKTYPSDGVKQGVIIQIPSTVDSFADDLKDSLRCFPASQRGSMLLIGEIRDHKEAALALQASVNGLLVIATLHAQDPIKAIVAIHSKAASEMGAEMAQSLLGQGLRAVVHQRLEEGVLSVSQILSKDSATDVATLLAAGKFNQLSTAQLQQQREFDRREAGSKAAK